MTKEEHAALTAQILENLSEQGAVSELLSQLSDDYISTLTMLEAGQAENKTLKGDIDNLQDEIKKLKESNMALYLKVTSTPKEDDSEENEESEKNDLSYDSLFNENGELN